MALYGIGVPFAAQICALGSSCFACIGKYVEKNPQKSLIVLSILGNEPCPTSRASARAPASVLEMSRVLGT